LSAIHCARDPLGYMKAKGMTLTSLANYHANLAALSRGLGLFRNKFEEAEKFHLRAALLIIMASGLRQESHEASELLRIVEGRGD